ncbi:MAG: hypothetical protein ACO1O3_09150 [Sphingobium sp.]
MTVMPASGALRPAFPSPVCPPKIPRERLLRLDVEGERDASFLGELLDLVRAHALMPLGIAIDSAGARMRVRLEFDRAADGAGDALVERLRNRPAIRKAGFVTQD